jgi:AcrR family transcriptional regulator
MKAKTTMRPRAHRRGQAREAILAAATGRFLRDGFAATRMDAVAADARTGKGTIYQHFPTKEDLLLACCLRQAEAAGARIEAAAADGAAAADPVAALARTVETALLAAVGGDGAAQRLFHDLWLALADRPDEAAAARARLREQYARWEGVIAFVYATGAARGDFRPLGDAAFLPRLVTAAVDGFAWQRPFRDDPDPRAAARATAALIAAMAAR